MNDSNHETLATAAVKAHAVVTLLLGLLYVVYHLLWIGHAEAPFETPGWLVTLQLSWGILSFVMIFVYQREERSPVLPALYVTFTGATYSYVWYLGSVRGSVTDEMVPTWWKVGSAVVGFALLMEGTRQLRR